MIQYYKDTLVVDVVQNYRYYGKCQETRNKIYVTLHVLAGFLMRCHGKKNYLENLQYNLDNWDGLAHLTRRYTCKLVIQRKYSKELAEMNDV